jgi:hypothetical protein
MTLFRVYRSFFSGIAAGPDGNLWFTDCGQIPGRIGRVTPGGSIREFNVPNPNACPEGIAAGQDGNLWFTDDSGFVDRVTPAGTFMQFALRDQSGFPWLITAGPDGNVWFTELAGNKIGRLEDSAAHTGYVLSLASGFAPATRTLPLGDVLQWSFYQPSPAAVADSSGMQLFASGQRRLVSYYSFVFNAAGTYAYADPGASEHAGQVAVPMEVSPPSGSLNSQGNNNQQGDNQGGNATVFTVTWATQSAFGSYAYDVEKAYCASSSCTPHFEPWHTGVRAPSGQFTPDKVGKYLFHSRLRKTSNGTSSGWSPASSILVSP